MSSKAASIKMATARRSRDLREPGSHRTDKKKRSASSSPRPHKSKSAKRAPNDAMSGILQKSLVLNERKGKLELEDRPVQVPGQGEVLVRLAYVGLNPIDWKSVHFDFGIHSLPWINGREGAGIVEQVGAHVTTVQPGDRVFVPSTNYRDLRTSTFQTYAIARQENVGKLPEFIPLADAAAIGVGLVTAACVLYDSLGIKMSKHRDPATVGPDGRKWLLVWGGACIVGTFVIQLGKLAGFRVAAVASARNADYLTSLGAEKVFDRANPTNAADEAKCLGISYAVDSVGADTAALAAGALLPQGELVCIVKAPREVRSDITVQSVRLKQFHEDLDYGRRLTQFASRLLESKTLVPPRIEVLDGGLEHIPRGLDKIRSGAVSGRRIVVRLASVH